LRVYRILFGHRVISPNVLTLFGLFFSLVAALLVGLREPLFVAGICLLVAGFCDLLDEMTRSTDTRFIIITHNPITMARMNRLFGVTMAERGVSQLVSVDLEEATKILDQNVA